MTEERDPTYLERLGLERDWVPAWDEPLEENSYRDLNGRRREAAFNRAHEIRKFEIELYWKRTGYFWLMQAAIFAALGFMWKGGGEADTGLLPLGLASLGFLTAVASWFAAEGSKFWQENWERHIDHLEDDHEGALHKTVWIGRDGVRWSVSGTNGWLNIFFALFWLCIFASELAASVKWGRLGCICSPGELTDWSSIKALTIALATALGFVLLWSRGTRLEGNQHWPRLITYPKTSRKVVSRSPDQ